jgi:hypothetical protein
MAGDTKWWVLMAGRKSWHKTCDFAFNREEATKLLHEWMARNPDDHFKIVPERFDTKRRS